ncbi:uncharacterized protein [Mytilus edulis]|uniref:Uncharacterized protein n=1 Tax=Mytilus galloprovincialis TaxID=29158 RepID=A0A8B6E8Q9_MYTGA|nr:Hypothetical predicted protein [Mytilus galloprovincialis]
MTDKSALTLLDCMDIAENVEIVESNKNNEAINIMDEICSDVNISMRNSGIAVKDESSIKGIPKEYERVKPDPRAMRVLLRHLYDTTGQLYEDVPPRFKTSHIGLALYLKHCLQHSYMLK